MTRNKREAPWVLLGRVRSNSACMMHFNPPNDFLYFHLYSHLWVLYLYVCKVNAMPTVPVLLCKYKSRPTCGQTVCPCTNWVEDLLEALFMHKKVFALRNFWVGVGGVTSFLKAYSNCVLASPNVNSTKLPSFKEST